MIISPWQSGDATCTFGLSGRIYNYWVGDPNNGFSPNLSGKQKEALRSQCYQWAQAIVDEFNLDDVFGGGGGGGGPTTALLVSFTPSGDLSSTNVQNAIIELRNDTDNKLLDYLRRDGTLPMTGNLNGGGVSQAINFLDPTSPQSLATKSYVDAVAAGLIPKFACQVATTTNITLSGSQVVDSVSVTNQRVLVKNQIAQQDNGIYDANPTGPWTRATDADTSPEVKSGLFTFIQGGGQAGTGWVLITSATIVLGTTPLPFTQFSGPGAYTNGIGILLVGNQFSADFGTGAGKVVQGNDPALTNDRVATGLRTLTTVVDGTASPAPSPGMFPIATSSTAFQWGFVARTTATYSGAGPFSIPAVLTDRAIFPTPGFGAIANLPSIANASVIDGWRIAFVNSSSGSDMVLLMPNGTDTIGGQKFYRIWQQGNIVLVADKATNTWTIETEHVGFPSASFTINVSTTGNDNNPGTAASPVRRIRQAVLLADVQWTSGNPTISVPAGYSSNELSLGSVEVPKPKLGSNGSPLTIAGPTPIDAGFGTITATGGNVSTTTSFPTITYGTVSALANNGGEEYFLWGLSGSLTNRRFAIISSSSTSLEFARIGATFPSGTFEVRKPNAAAQLTLRSTLGASLTITDMDLYISGLGAQSIFSGLTLTLTRCRGGLSLTNCTSILSPFIIPFDGAAGGGIFVKGGSLSLIQSALLVQLAVDQVTQTSVSVTTSGCDDTFLVGYGPGQITVSNSSTLVLSGCIFRNVKFIGAAANDRSTMTIGGYFNSPTNSPVGAPFSLKDKSIGRFGGVTGNIGSLAPYAVTVQEGSLLEADPTTDVNANGAGNAVNVGSSGVFAWSAIPVTDLDQLCRVTTM